MFTHSLTMSALPFPPLSANPFHPPSQGDGSTPLPPDKGGAARPSPNRPLRQIRRHEKSGLNQKYEREPLARLAAFPAWGQPVLLSTND